ncbi:MULTISPECIES: IclR family transcriptional regulator domain-containing protein [Nocardiaceae]|uniref:IclR family transcriptional regulator domain-containing protein n=1 Tax=Nocardiaceae TaxID=85025 RepID=UPI00055CA1E2|nr:MULTISPECIES: IclR family transcriptional regulator C-terminal domain-containing protein [Rhodococcus]OZE95496.1 IclR family transcriptional regulator [Rhodococcus sp. 15-1189-1-1a]OZF10127.1 IclR family transcriptional regulator [Rhodococcus sp. 14-2686-1-2]
MSDNERDYIQSIERGFAVLLAFDASTPNPTLAEIASATELSRPAVRRILLTLQRLGYVTGVGTRWSLTPRVLSIGQHYTETHSLLDASTPRLLELAKQTDESASLGVLDGPDVVYAARVPVRRIMSINVSVGTRVPAYATSMGRALLAWAPPESIDDVLDATNFTQLVPGTITDRQAILNELAAVREHGYALISEELEQGLISLAAPVRDAVGSVVGVVACSTSTARNTVDQFRVNALPHVLAAANGLSEDLGYRA